MSEVRSVEAILTERSALVSEYNAICSQLGSIDEQYARLEEIKSELAAGEAEASEALSAAGMSAGSFAALPTPPKVRLVVPQVKVSEARTARLQWILDNQGETGVSAHVAEGEESALDAMIKATGREGAEGDAYNILSGFARAGYCTDNGERGVEKRTFFVNTSNEHVIEWLGL